MLKPDGTLINPEIRIETTNRCQANCIICPRDQMTRELETMSQEDFCDIVIKLSKYKPEMISLFGMGEPLIDKGLEAKIGFANFHGYETFITTNAGLLDFDRIHILLNSGLTKIRFSVHALYPNDYEEIHKGLNYKVVDRNISNFLGLNEGFYGAIHDRIETHLSVIPMNGESIKDIKDKWEKVVDYLEIWKPHNWAGGKDFRKVDKQMYSCGRPFVGPLQINVDGSVMICCFDYDGKMTIGNILEQSLEEILDGEEYKGIREVHKLGLIQMLPCNKCDQLNRYNEENNPLLYSNRDESKQVGRTSSNKFYVGDYRKWL